MAVHFNPEKFIGAVDNQMKMNAEKLEKGQTSLINTKMTVNQFENVLHVFDQHKNQPNVISSQQLSEWTKMVKTISENEKESYQSGIKGFFRRIGSVLSSIFSGHGAVSIADRGMAAFKRADELLKDLNSNDLKASVLSDVQREEIEKKLESARNEVKEAFAKLDQTRSREVIKETPQGVLPETTRGHEFEKIGDVLVNRSFVQDFDCSDSLFNVLGKKIKCRKTQGSQNVRSIIKQFEDAGVSGQAIKNITTLIHEDVYKDLIEKMEERAIDQGSIFSMDGPPEFEIKKNDAIWLISFTIRGTSEEIEDSKKENVFAKRIVAVTREDFEKDWSKNPGKLIVRDIM